jgi:small subunit ribosomal protein S15
MKKREFAKKNREEVEEIIKKLAEQMPPEKIGLVLRDEYGIPKAKLITKKISQLIKDKIKEPSDIVSLIKKADQLKKHLEKNKMDKVAKRGLQITRAKIIKLSKYYKKNKILPQDWKYS